MQSPEINELASALVKAQAEFSAVPKGSVNPFFKSKYAALPDVVQSASPVLTKHGLAVSQFITHDESGGDALLTYLIHESGQFIAYSMKLHMTKEDPQAQGSAVTYARRYSYMSALGLVADEDDDGNSATKAKASAPKAKPVSTQHDNLKAELAKKFPNAQDRKPFIEKVIGRDASAVTDLNDAEIASVMLELMQ